MRIPFALPGPEGRAFDVVGVGQNSVDFVAVAATYPAPNSKQRLEQFVRLPGGQIATAMLACARLGWRARYIGSFGDDDLGRLARESLTRGGVDISAACTVPGASNHLAVILVDAHSGDRTVLWHRDPTLRLNPDVPEAAIVAGRLLLVDCDDIAAAAVAARVARRARMPTMVDVEEVRPGIKELLQQIDVIIAAQAFPTSLTGYLDTGRALEAMAREHRAAVVCVTLGKDGSLARCGGREIRTRPFAVECIDSTGAGDAFRGGFAAACFRWPAGEVEDVLSYANAVAALNCRALGASGGLPTEDEVDQLLQARPAI